MTSLMISCTKHLNNSFWIHFGAFWLILMQHSPKMYICYRTTVWQARQFETMVEQSDYSRIPKSRTMYCGSVFQLYFRRNQLSHRWKTYTRGKYCGQWWLKASLSGKKHEKKKLLLIQCCQHFLFRKSYFTISCQRILGIIFVQLLLSAKKFVTDGILSDFF